MSLHRRNYRTSYECAAVNRTTGEQVFVVVSNGRSRQNLQKILFHKLNAGDTRFDRICAATGTAPDSWEWSKVASQGIHSGDWSVRFTGRTALEVDQSPLARSIYREPIAA